MNQDSDVQTPEGQDDAPLTEDVAGVKFSKDQLQQLASMTGRLIKKQLDESLPQYMPQAPPSPPPADNLRAIDEFNQKLQNKIFEGDVVGAFQEYNNVYKRAETNLRASQENQLKKAMTAFADKPFYKDTYQDAEQIAKEAMSNGVAPEFAAQLGYAQAVANRHTGGSDTGGLTLEGGGKRPPQKKKAQLPERFKAAAARDIAKGFFKDEAEYIANLSPEIRNQYGI